ncbi:1-deoxy-D-xylulose-5-phosphate synthase [Pontibacter sp. JAM-7]|uniref:1-deoxy-D-xylulose-5-phosphate synthase n=1 Tax=Pontibacter sp. JAM-7 TaxID=3366581 RepID=UPI003AF6B9A6
MFHAIPSQRPDTPLLDQIEQPSQLRQLSSGQLPQLAEELRAYLLYSVGQSGGHFGAGLGVIELTVALHYLLQTPEDHLVWDVGHQCYPHKILTGRREQLTRIRKAGGPSPFPKRDESEYDSFGVGHSSTSISAALGMALADRILGQCRKTVAVIGDGAMTAGMAFEALNHAAHTHANILVILNDNDMSISRNEGGLATYLAKNLKNQTAGDTTSALFEALDFHYSGPIDGHDFNQLLPALQAALERDGPQFLHILTRKGKGFAPAEADPVGYHSLTKIEPIKGRKQPKRPSFSNLFSEWICATAANDPRLSAITPAMREGSDLIAFSEQFSERYFDVAIAEQHALTLAAGMACTGAKPVVAIYSTFLQRAYDQLIHDASLQKLDLLLALDRAGLVGEDGATHAGCFDIAMLRCLPETVIMTPSDGTELQAMLSLGYKLPGLAAVRYPRGAAPDPVSAQDTPLTLGQAQVLHQGHGVALLNFGPLLHQAMHVAKQHNYTLVDMRFVKPLDQSCIKQLTEAHPLLVTIEDHAIAGGAGSAVSEYLHQAQLDSELLCLGIPDRWIAHASRPEQLAMCGLDSSGIAAAIELRLASVKTEHQ